MSDTLYTRLKLWASYRCSIVSFVFIWCIFCALQKQNKCPIVRYVCVLYVMQLYYTIYILCENKWIMWLGRPSWRVGFASNWNKLKTIAYADGRCFKIHINDFLLPSYRIYLTSERDAHTIYFLERNVFYIFSSKTFSRLLKSFLFDSCTKQTNLI